MTNPVVIDTTPGQPFADITREFEAPVAAVFRAHADRELYAQWSGPDGYGAEVTEWSFRAGGGYRFVHADPEGVTYGFRGVFHTVRENEIIIQTFECEAVPDSVSLDILRFEELPGGRSRLVERSVFADPAALEEMMAQGMTQGVTDGYAKLDALIAQDAG